MGCELAPAGSKKHWVFCINLPAPLSRSLREAGYTRARLLLMNEGILVKPYKGERKVPGELSTVALPEGWGT
jgi:hypothetical protein